MKYRLFLLLIIFSFATVRIIAQPSSGKRLKRSDSFFGIHFDFHAQQGDMEIGKRLTEGMIDSMLFKVKPDFIQVDCKGHAGYSSYPTKVGHQAGGFVKDPLQMFRDVTARHNVALYVHYSGVWDDAAIKSHPQWARIDNNGKPDPQKTSFNSGYADSLMIPQLKELSKVYNIDGAWIDGDCWATLPDYSPAASKAFLAQSGLPTMPKGWGDEGYIELLEFTRKNFRNYVSHYVDAIHDFDPDFQITSNWAYTGFMPEPVTINLDYISGDLSPQNSVYSAAFEARCIAPQGKPWDLMGWSFSLRWGDSFRTQKTATQMNQEAAEVLALGGGFQEYYNQNRDASLQPWTINSMASVAEFCRQRQAYSHKGINIPQAAILYSAYGFKKQSRSVYGEGAADEVKGMMMMMLDAQYSVEIKSEHHLSGKLKDYGLVVIPGWEFLEESFKQELMDYVQAGGNLILLGPGPLHLFEKWLPVKILSDEAESNFYLGHNNQMGGIRSRYAKVQSDVPSRARFYQIQDFKESSSPASIVTKHGKGKIGAIFCNLGSSYANSRVDVVKEYFVDLVDELYDPAIEITGSDDVHVNLTEKGGKHYLHLINAGGPHNNQNVFRYNAIEKTGVIEARYKVDKKPAKILLQPGKLPLKFQYDKGWVSFKVPGIEIYSIAEITFN